MIFCTAMKDMRIGHGYDIHRLIAGRRLVLAGVEIASDRGLEGHSDADVACHAVTDAILGAAADGDIGTHFPPSEAKWKNANSLELLKLVMARLAVRSVRVINVDLTIVAEAPRIGPYAAAMRANLAAALGVSPNRVGVKATTNEGMGPEGRGEGISATAVCLLELDDA